MNSDTWAGRISVRTTDPRLPAPQQFSAGFLLSGTPAEGELSLYTPLGTTLAKAHWAPDMAVLTQGNTTQTYANMDALSAALTGEPLPLQALFGWLNGRDSNANGWTPDLTQHPLGRISATRRQADSDTVIRVVLDPPER